MEAPPPPTTAAPPLSSTVPLPSPHLNYPDSVDSSPRSRNADWDDSFPSTNASSKLRLMCSYGGHIIPRPHDKSLCYVGGDTRIIVVERHTSLAEFSARLSKTFLNGRSFTLKYQLPSEDLDSLISVTTDEDLDNMIDEYDRTAANSTNLSVKPSRLRLFLFPTKPDSSQSIGPILDSSAKSDDWFLNALNSAGMLNRGFSESASVNSLLGLDDEVGGNNLDPGSREAEAAQAGSFGNGKNLKQGQDVHSVPDSPMLETTSSFGSTSSSPLVANLPPIRVRVDDVSGGKDQKVGIEEQFAQLGVGSGHKQEEGFAVLSSPPPMPATILASSGVPISSAAVEHQNRVFSDDERSDHGVPVGNRKPPTPQPQPQALLPQFHQKSTGVVDLPSPDSVSSDSSLTNAMSRQKPVIYQEQVQVQIPSGTKVPSNAVDPKLNISDPHARIQMQQQLQEPGYLLQQQFEQQQQQQLQEPGYLLQQQFEQQQQQQLQEPGYLLQQQFEQQQQQQLQEPGYLLQQQFEQQQQQQLQEPGYLLQKQFEQQQQQHLQEPGYLLQQQFEQQQQQPQQQQQFIHGTHFIHHSPAGAVPMPAYYSVYPSQQQPHPHHQLDQQYPVYYVPARQHQAYNLPVQPQNISETTTTIPTSRAQAPPNPAMVAPSATYNPMRNAPIPKSERTAAAYRTATAGTPQLVQVPPSQHQQQFVAYSQIHHSPHSVAPNSASPASYAYDYVDPAHAQIYYTQPLAPTMPSQYQTMTAAATVLPEVSAQLTSDSMKQQIRTSQPL
ncbi:hypothetical protein L6164_001668 [Bauhinia variegata]|uniref:Uncharacterized protein n=1 Tax=Bauhinia variegata TaxID=167791 RepID=A0ACB9QCL6_BAUVA|nr:hypothetical protein L6164_001668 [Bauhinia variegata]